jgi:hypothetical protein
VARRASHPLILWCNLACRVIVLMSTWEASILALRFALFSAVACLLCACAANNQQGWAKEGASPSDFDKDSQLCMLNNENRPTGLRNRDINEDNFDGCLASRGWARNRPQ